MWPSTFPRILVCEEWAIIIIPKKDNHRTHSALLCYTDTHNTHQAKWIIWTKTISVSVSQCCFFCYLFCYSFLSFFLQFLWHRLLHCSLPWSIWINKQKEILALDSQKTKQPSPESPTVTPPVMRICISCSDSLALYSHTWCSPDSGTVFKGLLPLVDLCRCLLQLTHTPDSLCGQFRCPCYTR